MSIFTENNFSLTATQREKFEKLYTYFLEWNGKINLSAIRDRDGIFEKHFVDSLLGMKFLDFNNKSILDLGSGGGFPVLPLAIMNEDSTFMAVDSVGKKTKAIADMAQRLNLPVKTTNDRIETLGQDPLFREKFDIVTARALAPWPTLLEYTLPFVKKGGYFMAYQGPSIMKDLEVYENLETRLGGKIERITAVGLGDSERIFILIKKKTATPKKYPRMIGEPKKNPLK